MYSEPRVVAVVVVIVGAAFVASACAENVCTRHSDCAYGDVCSAQGLCVAGDDVAMPDGDGGAGDARTSDGGTSVDGHVPTADAHVAASSDGSPFDSAFPFPDPRWFPDAGPPDASADEATNNDIAE